MDLQSIITARDPNERSGEGQYHFMAQVGHDNLYNIKLNNVAHSFFHVEQRK